STDTAAPSGPGRIQVAPAARRLAKERGVDLDGVRGTGPDGLIRIEDVEAAAGHGSSSSDGTLDAAFLENLRRDAAAFAALDSRFKLQLYRRHGAIIGQDAFLAPGAVLLVERIVLGDGAYFGADTSVEGRELCAGDLLHFGRNCRVRCTRIACGDNAFFTDDIEIGGGGALDPEAELVVGSHGFVGEHVHLNPCRRLEIGDEVVISRNAVVMTHSFGGSILKGYPNRFAGVRLGSYCQVGIQATLFPGVEMGEGSILLSGSSLVSSVPAGRLFGGVPAVDMKSASQPLDRDAFARVAFDLVAEFARQLGLRGRSVEVDEGADEVVVRVTEQGRTHALRASTVAPGDLGTTFAEEVRVVTAIDDAEWDDAPSDVVTIDLSAPRIQGPDGPLAAAFREFLRKRGVRLHPRSWTYRGGWL
ncbi:MAG: E3 binding domain-containing protein, partial [Planctomycetes bacterium]|nr:E3 binding domain-containing protein [Planctomycetota bacterium]